MKSAKNIAAHFCDEAHLHVIVEDEDGNQIEAVMEFEHGAEMVVGLFDDVCEIVGDDDDDEIGPVAGSC